MSNYEKARQAAAKHFTSYDMNRLAARPGVTDGGEELTTFLFGAPVRICKTTGDMWINGIPANFCQALSVYDWLCDGKPDARASGVYAPVGSLPGVLVGGSGLMMEDRVLAKTVDADPERFCAACRNMGGREIRLGDLGFEVPIFPDLSMQLKFYFADEEFPPSLTFLWDKNILDFVRYETVYYIAGVLRDRLMEVY